MAGIIDVHTHAFPDKVARAAIPTLEKCGGIKAYRNGTVADLLASMDAAGVERSVLCSIATKPEQFQHIFDWSQKIRSERILPFPSVHPHDPELIPHLEQIHAAGFLGVKMHPYYQDYFLDDPELFPLYQRMSELALVLAIHAGYDIAFPKVRRSNPERIVDICKRFPDLKMIATHLGGWGEWEEVKSFLAGKPIFMEISFALTFLEPDKVRDILLRHPADYLLFGTDSPWSDQAETLQLLENLDLPGDLFTRMTRTNPVRLLKL